MCLLPIYCISIKASSKHISRLFTRYLRVYSGIPTEPPIQHHQPLRPLYTNSTPIKYTLDSTPHPTIRSDLRTHKHARSA